MPTEKASKILGADSCPFPQSVPLFETSWRENTIIWYYAPSGNDIKASGFRLTAPIAYLFRHFVAFICVVTPTLNTTPLCSLLRLKGRRTALGMWEILRGIQLDGLCPSPMPFRRRKSNEAALFMRQPPRELRIWIRNRVFAESEIFNEWTV